MSKTITHCVRSDAQKVRARFMGVMCIKLRDFKTMHKIIITIFSFITELV